MANIPTPHIEAKAGDFAPTVLMPGDPLRSKFIAVHFLENPVLVNNIRGVQGYTGNYHGKRVSVMASGMGMPAIGIYSYELFNFYGVENIIRIGSAGIISQQLKLRDIVAGMSVYTNSNFGQQYGFQGNVGPCCSWTLPWKRGRGWGKRRSPGLSIPRIFSTTRAETLPRWKSWACWQWRWKRQRCT